MPRPKGSSSLISPRRKAITPEEYILIQATCRQVTTSSDINLKWALYFSLMWETGIRPSEALHVRAKDVKDGAVEIRRLKKKGRPIDIVTIQPHLQLELQSYISKNKIKPDRKLFLEGIMGARYIFEKIKKMVRLRPELTLHSFRHGFAMNFLRQTPLDKTAAEGLALLQRSLGHANISATGVYIKADEVDVAKQIRGMKF
jgi:integrase